MNWKLTQIRPTKPMQIKVNFEMYYYINKIKAL
jgi:hypothetical protein